MSKSNLYLFIGPKGSGKSNIVDHLKKSKSDENLFVPNTTIAVPVDMVQQFQKNPHYTTVKHREFRERAVTKTFKFIWKEFNELQLEYVIEENMTKNVKENHNMIYKGFNGLEIEGALAARRDIVLNLSNTFLFKTKQNMYIDNDKNEKFNLLRQVVNSLKDICNIKIIFVRSPKALINKRLEEMEIYNKDEIESIVSHGIFMMNQNTLELCLPDEVTVSYIDNNSTIEEAAQRAWTAMISSHEKEEVKTYYNERQESEHYIDKNNVTELMEYLLNSIILDRPSDPILFLIMTLGKLKQRIPDRLMTEEDVQTMFDLIDINSKGSISTAQVITCMENLQLSHSEIELAKKKFEKRDSVEKIEFTSTITSALNTLKNTPWN